MYIKIKNCATTLLMLLLFTGITGCEKYLAKKSEKTLTHVSFETDGVFVFVGLKPNTGFLKGSPVELDEQGLIKTDSKLHTSMPGVFASGDVRSGATMQIASAVGEGASAALSIREYLEEYNRAASAA